jgi:glycosyltransferase involved in cell wall biosynthesis
VKQIQLIHVVESSKRYGWFDKLFAHLAAQGFTQALVTLEPKGEINKSLLAGKITVKSPSSKSVVMGSIQVIGIIFKLRKSGCASFLVLHGHRASIVGSLAARVAKLDFGIVHHVQPKYFELLSARRPIRGSVHQMLYHCYIKRAKIVQALSKEVTQSLETFGVEPRKIVAVGHGVDFEEFQKLSENVSGEIPNKTGFPRILMVGRLAWEKNYPHAIEVFEELHKSYPQAQLLIAGSGPAEAEIKLLVGISNLTENVIFLGRVGNVPELMKNSDLLLHCAMTESYGQVYIEACLSGLPIFTFPTGIAIDLAENPASQVYLLTQSDPKCLSAQIVEFLLNVPQKRLPDVGYLKDLYRSHDQEEVFQEMSRYLKRLIPDL